MAVQRLQSGKCYRRRLGDDIAYLRQPPHPFEIDIIPQKPGRRYRAVMMKREPDNSQAMPAYRYTPVGEIPQSGTTMDL